MKFLRILAPSLLLALSLGFFLLSAYGGPYGFWGGAARLSGAMQDWGKTDFGRLSGDNSASRALVCAPAFCPRASDFAQAPIINMSGAELAQSVKQIILAQPRAQLIEETETRLRFVTSTPVLRVPAIIDIEILPIDAMHATLAIYGRSLPFFNDSKHLDADVRRWLDALGARGGLTG